MALESDATIEEIQGRKGYQNTVTDGEEDISGGVEHVVGNVPAFTVYIHATATINVSIELSPDGGTNWYTLDESPVEMSAAGDTAVHIKYNATHIRLTGSTGDPVKVQIREVM